MLQYRLIQPEPLVSPEWGASAVVFDRRTGSTHLVSSMAATLLTELGNSVSGCDQDELVALVATSVPSDDPEEINELVRDALTDLAKTGLIATLDAD